MLAPCCLDKLGVDQAFPWSTWTFVYGIHLGNDFVFEHLQNQLAALVRVEVAERLAAADQVAPGQPDMARIQDAQEHRVVDAGLSVVAMENVKLLDEQA